MVQTTASRPAATDYSSLSKDDPLYELSRIVDFGLPEPKAPAPQPQRVPANAPAPEVRYAPAAPARRSLATPLAPEQPGSAPPSVSSPNGAVQAPGRHLSTQGQSPAAALSVSPARALPEAPRLVAASLRPVIEEPKATIAPSVDDDLPAFPPVPDYSPQALRSMAQKMAASSAASTRVESPSPPYRPAPQSTASSLPSASAWMRPLGPVSELASTSAVARTHDDHGAETLRLARDARERDIALARDIDNDVAATYSLEQEFAKEFEHALFDEALTGAESPVPQQSLGVSRRVRPHHFGPTLETPAWDEDAVIDVEHPDERVMERGAVEPEASARDMIVHGEIADDAFDELDLELAETFDAQEDDLAAGIEDELAVSLLGEDAAVADDDAPPAHAMAPDTSTAIEENDEFGLDPWASDLPFAEEFDVSPVTRAPAFANEPTSALLAGEYDNGFGEPVETDGFTETRHTMASLAPALPPLRERSSATPGAASRYSIDGGLQSLIDELERDLNRGSDAESDRAAVNNEPTEPVAVEATGTNAPDFAAMLDDEDVWRGADDGHFPAAAAFDNDAAEPHRADTEGQAHDDGFIALDAAQPYPDDADMPDDRWHEATLSPDLKDVDRFATAMHDGQDLAEDAADLDADPWLAQADPVGSQVAAQAGWADDSPLTPEERAELDRRLGNGLSLLASDLETLGFKALTAPDADQQHASADAGEDRVQAMPAQPVVAAAAPRSLATPTMSLQTTSSEEAAWRATPAAPAPVSDKTAYWPVPEVADDAIDAFHGGSAPAHDGAPIVDTAPLDAELIQLTEEMELPEIETHPDALIPNHPDDIEADMAGFRTASGAGQASQAGGREHRFEVGDGGIVSRPAARRAGPDPQLSGEWGPVKAFRPEEIGEELDLSSFENALNQEFSEQALPHEARPQSRRRGMLVAALLGGVAILGVTGLAAFNWLGGDIGNGGPVIIKADSSPIKEQPDEPGGRTVPNQNQVVYDQVNGANISAPSQETLVETAEEPKLVERKAAVELPEVAEKNDDRIAGDQTEEPLAALSPRKVRTVVVKPDGSIVAREVPSEAPAALAPAAAGLASVATDADTPTAETIPGGEEGVDTGALSGTVAEDIAAPQVEVEAPAAQGKAQERVVEFTPPAAAEETVENGAEAQAALPADDGQSAGADVSAEEPVATATAETPAEAPAAVESEALPATPVVAPKKVATTTVDRDGNIKPAAKTKPKKPVEVAQAPAAAAPAGASSGGYVVQIASQPSAELAQQSATNLARRYGSVIGGRGIAIQKANISGKGTFYRVRVSAGSKAEAQQLCSQLKAAGGSCFVSR